MMIKNRILELKPELEYENLEEGIIKRLQTTFVYNLIEEIKELVAKEFDYAIDYSYEIEEINENFIILKNISVLSKYCTNRIMFMKKLKIKRQ